MKEKLKSFFWSLIPIVLFTSCKDGHEAAMPWKDQMLLHGQYLAADILETLDSCQSVFYDNGVAFLIAAIIMMIVVGFLTCFNGISGFWSLFITWNLYIACSLAYFAFSLPTASDGSNLPWLLRLPLFLGFLVLPFFQYIMTIPILNAFVGEDEDGEDFTSRLVEWQVKLSLLLLIPILFCMMWSESNVDTWYNIYFGVQAVIFVVVGIKCLINNQLVNFIIYFICACIYIPSLVLAVWYVTAYAIVPIVLIIYFLFTPSKIGKFQKSTHDVIDEYGHTVDTVDGSNNSIYDGTHYNQDDMGNLYK